ncbi:MAG TPA: acyl-CoA dehydrogenase family protein [Gammaproteobacteria bacterium]|nr:acyl-CoA dehydrogenase family protein [Gammaproteobacteria bacterium]
MAVRQTSMGTIAAGVDFDFGLGDDVDLLRETVRRFAAERIAPRAAEIDASNAFPRDLWPALGEVGLLGLTLDPAHGGAGLGFLHHVVAMEEISRASASVGLSYAAHSNLCANQINRWGSEEQKRRFLPGLADGSRIGALAMTESDAGSDVLAMRTRAVRDGDDYLLDGTKMWITNGPVADTLVVYARTAGEGEPAGLKAFVVERGMPGFSAGPKIDKLGMRGSDTSALAFDRCRVPAANVLGGDGTAILMSGLDLERIVLAGGPLGIMRAAMDLVMPYLHARKQFGRPIGSFELMQGKVADLYSTMNAARAYVYAVAAASDRGRTTRFDAAAAILKASESATWMAGQAIQALGGNGYSSEYPAGRLLRDAKLYEIGAGTNEIRRMLVGRELFAATAEQGARERRP